MPSELDRAMDTVVDMITTPGTQLGVSTATIDGREQKIFDKAPASLRDLLEFFLPVYAPREFLVYQGERYTFQQVGDQGRAIAAILQQRFGIAKGDRVAIAMRNYPEWISCFIGVVTLGAIAVPMNAWWTADELAYGLRDCGATFAIADEERSRRIKESGWPGAVLSIRTSHAVADELGTQRLEDLLAGAPAQPWFRAPIHPDDDAIILYTSGSTGPAKGAVSAQRAVVSAVLSYLVQMLAMLELSRQKGVTLPEQQVMLLNLPLFHVTGLIPVMLVSVAIGRKLVIMHRWDAGTALRLIDEEKVTYFVGVPTMSLELMQHPDRDKYDLSSLTDIAAGGGPRPPEHVARLAKAFPGKSPALGYGLTETNAVGAGNMRDNYLAKPWSTGRASRPMVEIGIFTPDHQPLTAHETGEICIRSVCNARGYWRNPEATAENFTPDGWFRTGDLGQLDDDGYLRIVDRLKDIIIRGGENVSAAEVEAAIYNHPAVAECAVVGMPDERLGEIVGAIVYPKPGEPLEGESLIQFVARDLASFKVPARVWIADQPLPKLGSGKIDKLTIRKQLHELYTTRNA